jgi:hypothetical protein
MVECGVGITIAARHMVNYSPAGLSFLKLRGYEEFFRVSCIWNRETNPCLGCFLDVAGQFVS